MSNCFLAQPEVYFSIIVLILQSKQKSGGTQLFESDDDDDGGTDRFQIKPQFEGKAGRKVCLFKNKRFQLCFFEFSFEFRLHFSSWFLF